MTLEDPMSPAFTNEPITNSALPENQAAMKDALASVASQLVGTTHA